jgi:hypothetical protein
MVSYFLVKISVKFHIVAVDLIVLLLRDQILDNFILVLLDNIRSDSRLVQDLFVISLLLVEDSKLYFGRDVFLGLFKGLVGVFGSKFWLEKAIFFLVEGLEGSFRFIFEHFLDGLSLVMTILIYIKWI